MSELRDLYQQVIIEHSRSPRNFGKLESATHEKEGFNPLCGDKLKLYLIMQGDTIKAAQFEGCGCAISVATASLMTEMLKDKTMPEVEKIFTEFHDVVTGVTAATPSLGKLAVLAGVAEYPMRVKCATLAWHTALTALRNEQELQCVSTE